MTALEASPMQKFLSLHLPIREDGKIEIPQHVKHVKLDIGLSYSAPMSQYWLSHEEDLWVFGFEPNLNSITTLINGAVKQDASHGEPLEIKYIGKAFFAIPCALGMQSETSAPLYITKNDSGCSSLYQPRYFEIDDITEVPVYRLSEFFDLFPFDTHPLIEYVKIDAQGADLDIVKSAGQYLEERIVYVTLEAENDQYESTTNSQNDIDEYMNRNGFERVYSKYTSDPTYFNTRFSDYVKTNKVKIFQNG